MRDDKKVKYNLIVGIAGQAMAMLLGVLVPKFVLTSYGSEINGLLSSVTNIYAYIALVEAGIAAASCQALYKPIANNDKHSINTVLSATNQYYHKTGCIYLVLILIFSTLYPVIIDTDIPYVTIALVILFNGIGNVVNYFFHGKYLILLKADGKQYIRSGLEITTNALKQIFKIVFISLGFNVVLVQFVAMLANLLHMVFITFYIKKHYAWIDLTVKPDHRSISQSKNVLVHEINYLITSNVDVFLLTAFTTLRTVSVYSLYHLLFSMVNKVLHIVRDSFEFKLAKLFNRDRIEFNKMFKVFETCYITFSFALFSIASYFILPFITLYTKGVTDVQYIGFWIPILFVQVNLLLGGRYPSDAMIHIAGHFKQTQRSAMVESLINVLVSLALVSRFGIAGVLIGTIVSSLYRSNYLICYVSKNIIERSPKDTYKCWGVNYLIYLLIQYLSRMIPVVLNSYLRIFVFCVPYAIAILLIHFSILFALEPQIFACVLNMGKGLLRRSK